MRLSIFLQVLLSVRTYQIKKILEKEHCDLVIACTGDLFDPPAAFLASKALGIPFILYIFDYYSRQWAHSVLKSFAERYEKEIVNNAAHIIVPNECLQQEYLKRYDVRATVIHNPFDLTEYEQNLSIEEDTLHQDLKIVYTGAVYEAHYSAFRNLISAIKKTGISELKLHLYTPQSTVRLEMNDIVGPVVVHKHLPNQKMPDVQRNADILFLPLAFNSAYPEIIKTSAPGKIGEYLASKRPILVHAPKDSFVSWYFRKYHCGLVVDQDNPQLLAQAIARLLEDTQLQQTLSENAYVRTIEDFDIHNAQKKFNEILEL